MADNAQPTGFSKGVSTPKVSELETIAFKSGLECNTTPTPVSVNLGSANTGTTDFKLVIGSGASINGTYFVKLSVAGVICSVALACSARASATKPNAQNVINIISAETDDKSVILFKSAELPWGSGEVAVTLNFKVVTAQTAVTVDVSGIGNKSPVNVSAYNLSNWPNYTQPYTVHDVRDIVLATSQRVLGSNPVDLNSLVKPTTLSCNPASAGSRPDGTDGVGTCIVISSGDGNQVSQMFSTSSGSMYIRVSNDAGSTWGVWGALLTEAGKTEVLQQASSAALIWAIVMG